MVASITSDPKSRYTLPTDWPFQAARDLFLQPDVHPADHPACDFKWTPPDVEGLVGFLVGEKGFSEDRVRAGAARLEKNLKSAQQARLEGFFKPLPKTPAELQSLKRKADELLTEKKKAKKDEAKRKKDAKGRPRGSA